MRAQFQLARERLVGRRERVEALEGHFEFDSEPGAGVCVRAQIPLAPAASRATA